MKRVIICDANIIIDYARSNKTILSLASHYLYKIRIPLPVWKEVNDLTDTDAQHLGIQIVEPSLQQVFEVDTMHGGKLSDEDNTCFVMARDEKAICATNEKLLRNKCIRHHVSVLRGLEIMLKLNEINRLNASEANKTLKKIASDNPTITQAIIRKFTKKLK